MKCLGLFLSVALLLVSCRNSDKEAALTSHTQSDTALTAQGIDVENQMASPPYSVELNETTQELTIKRNMQNIEGLDTQDILDALNKKYPGIRLYLVSVARDSVKVKIADASQLTQQMGSTGAEAYLAEATYSLTELPGIKVVSFDFDEGDHAQPGSYTRESFPSLK
jgi:hypothetical protein